MQTKAFVVIDWAVSEGMHVVYIKHNNITAGTHTFKPGTCGEELVPELKVVSDNILYHQLRPEEVARDVCLL